MRFRAEGMAPGLGRHSRRGRGREGGRKGVRRGVGRVEGLRALGPGHQEVGERLWKEYTAAISRWVQKVRNSS